MSRRIGYRGQWRAWGPDWATVRATRGWWLKERRALRARNAAVDPTRPGAFGFELPKLVNAAWACGDPTTLMLSAYLPGWLVIADLRVRPWRGNCPYCGEPFSG